MHGKVRQFFENLVILAIILVLIQTFLEDISIVMGWDWTVRRILLTAGFGFDLFFTLEFLIRFFSSVSRGEGIDYLLRRKGWIDFFASIPLLLFNSSPVMLAVYFGGATAAGLGGVFNILKVAKAVRIARILRLLRVLKIFKQIKHAGSRMAQRHVSLVTTLTITVTVLSIFITSFVQQTYRLMPGVAEELEETEQSLLLRFDGENPEELAETVPSLLIIKKAGRTVYSRYDNSYYAENFGPMDYRHVAQNGYSFFLSVKPLLVDQAEQNLSFFILMILIVLVFLLYYSPHFAITVSDPIHIMRRGFAEPGYNLEVLIPERYGEDEVFQLAMHYNQEYLPLKERDRRESEHPRSDLSLESVSGIFQPKK
jgi:hypothetical protein